MSYRKPRSEGINAFPAHVKAEIHRWFLDESLSLSRIKARLFEKFRIKISVSALSSYYNRVGLRVLAENKLPLDVGALAHTSTSRVLSTSPLPDGSVEIIVRVVFTPAGGPAPEAHSTAELPSEEAP